MPRAGRILRSVLLLLLLSATSSLPVAVPASGQDSVAAAPDFGRQELQRTRAELEELLAEMRSVAESPAYSSRLRERARANTRLIRTRLERGDFQVGDRVVLSVEGEEQLSDTLDVRPGPRVEIPSIGNVNLHGVLRSELEERLTEALGNYLQDPRVRARALVRISVQGQVNQPGFYRVPSEMLVSDAIMVAGGPSSSANLEDLRIDRRNRTIWEGDPLQEALVDGHTLDQLSLRAGDQIVVPESSSSGFWGTVLRYGVVITSSVVLGRRVFF